MKSTPAVIFFNESLSVSHQNSLQPAAWRTPNSLQQLQVHLIAFDPKKRIALQIYANQSTYYSRLDHADYARRVTFCSSDCLAVG